MKNLDAKPPKKLFLNMETIRSMQSGQRPPGLMPTEPPGCTSFHTEHCH
jgi:hypothetical protein